MSAAKSREDVPASTAGVTAFIGGKGTADWAGGAGARIRVPAVIRSIWPHEGQGACAPTCLSSVRNNSPRRTAKFVLSY